MKTLKIALAVALLGTTGTAQAMPPLTNAFFYSVISPMQWANYEAHRFCKWAWGGTCTA